MRIALLFSAACVVAIAAGCTLFVGGNEPCDTDTDCAVADVCNGSFCVARPIGEGEGASGEGEGAGSEGEGEGEGGEGEGEGEGEGGAGEGEGGAGEGEGEGEGEGAPPLPTSCADILLAQPGAVSGQFTIDPGTGPVTVFCEMQRNGGGWTRVTLVDITAGDPCPSGWIDPPTDGFVDACVRDPIDVAQASAFFTPVIPYTELLGTIQAIPRGDIDAFGTAGNTIDSNYVDGISITTGASPNRVHLFTLAASHNNTNNDCPGDGGPGSKNTITGGEFACDKAANDGSSPDVSHPLWDDVMRDLPPGSTDRFFQSLPLATAVTGALEVRIMMDQSASDEQFAVTHVELYVR